MRGSSTLCKRHPSEPIGNKLFAMKHTPHDPTGSWSTVTPYPTWSTVTQDPTWSTVTHDPTWSTVTQDPTWSTVTQDPTWSTVTHDPTGSWSTVTPYPTWSTVTQDPTWSTVTPYPTWSTVTHDPTWPRPSVNEVKPLINKVNYQTNIYRNTGCAERRSHRVCRPTKSQGVPIDEALHGIFPGPIWQCNCASSALCIYLHLRLYSHRYLQGWTNLFTFSPYYVVIASLLLVVFIRAGHREILGAQSWCYKLL